MPEFYLKIAKEENLKRGVADFIAGMSDDYCLLLFNKISPQEAAKVLIVHGSFKSLAVKTHFLL